MGARARAPGDSARRLTAVGGEDGDGDERGGELVVEERADHLIAALVEQAQPRARLRAVADAQAVLRQPEDEALGGTNLEYLVSLLHEALDADLNAVEVEHVERETPVEVRESLVHTALRKGRLRRALDLAVLYTLKQVAAARPLSPRPRPLA